MFRRCLPRTTEGPAQLRGAALPRLLSLTQDERDNCVTRVRNRLARQGADQFVFMAELVLATGVKADIT